MLLKKKKEDKKMKKKNSTIERMKKGAKSGFTRSIEVIKGERRLEDAAKKVKEDLEKNKKKKKRGK